MIASQSVLAVIIGRAGSKGLPGKNSAIVAGRPMIAHTIDDALAAECVDRVVVSTDGEAIAATARAMNIEVVARPPALADDAARVDDAVRHAVKALGSSDPIIVILYANVPVRPEGLVDGAIRMLHDRQADSVQSYSAVGKHHPYWMVTLDDDGHVQPHVPNRVYRRQDLPGLFLPDGGVIVVMRESLCKGAETDAEPHAFLGRKRLGIISHGPVVDVDLAVDLAAAEAWLRMCGSRTTTFQADKCTAENAESAEMASIKE